MILKALMIEIVNGQISKLIKRLKFSNKLMSKKWRNALSNLKLIINHLRF